MMSSTTREVPAADWLAEVTAARDAGAIWFDSLHAVDEIGRPGPAGIDEIRVVVRLFALTDDGRELTQLSTRVDRAGGELPTLAGVFRGAAWHEREAHDFFGVRFAGGDDRPLLWHQTDGSGEQGLRPLLKDSVLVARSATPWPGAKDPEADGRTQASRRRTLPVGVPDPEIWGPAAGEVEPGEVAAAVSGARVRRRR